MNAPNFNDIQAFKNACKFDDIKTVGKLFNIVNRDVDMLSMRNLTVEYGHLNILQY